MYYSISETKLAQVNRLGQVTNVFDLDHYKLHHDYVFDRDGNLLILATDTTQDSILLLMKKIDENKNTFQLVDSFKVPYSGYVSSVQNIDNNTVVDSRFQRIFAEYDSSHNKINKTDVLQIFLRFFLQIRQFFYLLNQYNISILQMYRFLLHLLLQIRKCSPAPPQNRPRRLFLLSQYLQRCLYLSD